MRALAPRIGALPGAVILRSDVIRKTMLGIGELDRLPPTAYRPSVSADVYARVAAEAATIVKQGHSVIVDAVFAHESEAIGHRIRRKAGSASPSSVSS